MKLKQIIGPGPLAFLMVSACALVFSACTGDAVEIGPSPGFDAAEGDVGRNVREDAGAQDSGQQDSGQQDALPDLYSDAETDAEGDSGDTCLDGGCRPSCDTAAECEGESICVDGACVPCEGDSCDAPAEGGLAFAVISDLNGSYGSFDYSQPVRDSVQWIIDDIQPDLVLSTGDMIAGQQAGLDYRGMWGAFHAAVTDRLTAAGIPFAVTPGNHDASGYASFAGERAIYVEQWNARRPDVDFVDDEFYPLRYAFKVKGVLFISLDDTTVGVLSGTQRQWLRNVLTRNSDARARIVYGHIPLYPVTQGRETEILDDTDLEDLLNEFNVDIMFAGHHHGYYPGKRGDLRLASLACLGSGPRKLVGTDTTSPRSLIVGHISPDGELTFDAFDPITRELIPRSTLPESLNSGRHQMWRDDL